VERFKQEFFPVRRDSTSVGILTCPESIFQDSSASLRETARRASKEKGTHGVFRTLPTD
jgi:hypothetical protein